MFVLEKLHKRIDKVILRYRHRDVFLVTRLNKDMFTNVFAACRSPTNLYHDEGHGAVRSRRDIPVLKEILRDRHTNEEQVDYFK